MPCTCNHFHHASKHSAFRTALWIALALNLGMFFIEIFGGIYANSSSLWADALDFMGDSINYLVSLSVLNMSLLYRSWASFLKGLTMTVFGLAVLGKMMVTLYTGGVPEPLTMGLIGFLALICNMVVMIILYKFRGGDSNMQSVWLCSRNDMIGNCAILLASLGVLGTHTMFPDLLVASIMSGLGIMGGIKIMSLSRKEQKENKPSSSCSCCHE